MKKTFIIIALLTSWIHPSVLAQEPEVFTVSLAKKCVTAMQSKHISTYEIELVLSQNAASINEVLFPSIETKSFSKQIDGKDCWAYLIEMNHIALKEFNVGNQTLLDLINTENEPSALEEFQSVSWLQDQIRSLYPATHTEPIFASFL